MADLVMRCNDLQCRVELTDKAVVTTCSHIFCFRCAQGSGLIHQLQDQRICPACGTALIKSDDCVATALNPSEDYKSSILCGLNPSIIMECATRALEFYSYQAVNAVMYQEHLAQSLTARYKTSTDQLQQSSHELSQDLGKAREALNAYRTSCSELENKNHDLTVAFKEKSKALAETQSKYQYITQQAMLADVQHAASEDADHAMQTPRPSTLRPVLANSFYKPNTVTSMPLRERTFGPKPFVPTQQGSRASDRRAYFPPQSLRPQRTSQHSPKHSYQHSSHSSTDEQLRGRAASYSQFSNTKSKLPMPIGVSIGARQLRRTSSRAGGHIHHAPHDLQHRTFD